MTDYKEYIYAVYQEKSFSKAAKKLYVSQPWLSATVKKVEQELDVRLFDRSTTPISLTEAGAYYIQRVEEIRRIEQDMIQHFQELRNAQHRVLHNIAYCILAVLCFFVRMSYRIEIINTTNVANAIINDNASYTLMLIISLSRGKLGFSSDALSFRLQTMIKVWKNGSTTKKTILS